MFLRLSDGFLSEVKKSGKRKRYTSESSRDNVRPFVVRNHKGGQPDVLWMYNYEYPGFRAYNSAIRINQKAKGFSSELNKEAISQVANAVFDWQMKDYKEK